MIESLLPASGAAIASHPPSDRCPVLLEGDGIATVCAARLLTDAGVPCALRVQLRPRLAAILLGPQTQHLLREVFPNHTGSADLFSGFVRIERRIVLWGDAAAPVDLPHRGVVAPEADLLDRLWRGVPELPRPGPEHATSHRADPEHAGPEHADPNQARPSAYRLSSSRGGLAPSRMRSFGTRTGHVAAVDLSAAAEEACCWVESVASGWLFLLALGGGKGSLIAVGDTATALLASSRLIAPRIARIRHATNPMAVYPRLNEPLAAPGWIACGSAAMSFDPLCGEGAGHAVREGLMAAAVIRAALAGSPPELLGQHYTARLRQGMLRHLETCLPFYTTGGVTGFWTQEAESLRRGIDSLTCELNRLPPPRFRLIDRDLVPIQP